MKKITILFLLTFLLGAPFIHSQVPGYMGKRIHLQGGIKFFPQFGNVPVNVSQPMPGNYFISGVNYRLETGMDFMVTRKISLGFNLHYFNTAMYEQGIAGGYSNSPVDGRLALDGGGLGFVFKTHFGSWIAPLGSYYRLEVGGLGYSISNPLGNSMLQNSYPYGAGAGFINNAWGRTHIFANKISLDYGVEIGLVLPPWNMYGSQSPQSSANTRLLVQYIANVYVKIGGIF